MALTTREIAELVEGQLDGAPDVLVHGVAGVRDARAGEITFLSHSRYLPALRRTAASAVIVARDFAETLPGKVLIRVDNPSRAFTRVVERMVPRPVRPSPGVDATARVAPTAQLGAGVCIQAFVVIEPGVVIGARTVIGAGCYIGHDTVVGEDCYIYPRVTIRERTRVGHRVILHPGVVLGADGFGFETIRGEHQKVPQVGTVEIGDDVEIGANSCVDRGRFGTTRIGRGTKIDNLVQVGHNCVIGEHCVICAGTGIAGSVVIGNRVTLAGQVGVAGHLTIGDGAIIGAQSGVAHDVPAGAVMLGAPAEPHMQFKRTVAALQRLPELLARVRELERQLAALSEACRHS